MKKLLFFILSICSLISNGQSKKWIDELKKQQHADYRNGIVLLPLMSDYDSNEMSSLVNNFNVDRYNQEIIEAFCTYFQHPRIYFYYSRDLNNLRESEDFRFLVFDAKMNPVKEQFRKENVFIGRFDWRESLESSYKIYAKKGGAWKLVKQEKILLEEELSDYQKEIQMFQPEKANQKIIIERLFSEEIEIRKTRKIEVNFKTYFPLHFFLPSNIVFVRVAQEMNLDYLGDLKENEED